ERPEGDDERREADARHEHPVQEAAEGADDQHDHEGQRQGHAGGEQDAEDGRRQADHRLDREVDLARDDDQGHRKRHDRDLDDRRDEVRHVAPGQEHRRHRRPDGDQRDQEERQQDPPAGQPRQQPSVRGGHCPRRSETDRWNRRTRTASRPTATRITRPDTAWSQNCERRSRIRAFPMNVRKSAPRAAPMTLPDPPKMFTPTTTTAATTWSVTPVADVALIVPKRIPHITPATPASRPAIENATNVTSPARMPRIAAPSGLLPVAYTDRPKVVIRSTAAKPIAMATAMTTKTGMPSTVDRAIAV